MRFFEVPLSRGTVLGKAPAGKSTQAAIAQQSAYELGFVSPENFRARRRVERQALETRTLRAPLSKDPKDEIFRGLPTLDGEDRSSPAAA